MQIRIRLFASIAARAGTRELTLDLADRALAADVRTALQSQFPGLKWPAATLLAVNQEYVSPEHVLHNGDEVAIIPPVSGG